ncbi:MAG: hypothetical protein IT208_02980 [Chthonomonadales bacterium]|nr:hypothetical protein [Chthonomonadales bacterium]
MGDITDPRLICVKGFLFVLAGALASAGLLLQSPTLRTALPVAIAVWSFARFCYFAF